jgi:very-short-patch-repair endonuclease
MLIHQVDVDSSLEVSDKINVSEANAILKLFKELKANSKYQKKSIGILCFFNAQATYLRNVFEREGFKEEDYNYKISIIEGIQGDEKDIILYSFVIRNPNQIKQYYPLTGEGGDIRGDINKGRVNVAFSRARQQVHCFVSMPPLDIPDKIWLKKYLEYVDANGKVDSCSIELRPFDSHFEEEFYSLMKSKLGSDFLIQNQVPSCGFKIDFVVTNIKTEKKLAIECDGPSHFKTESDEEFGYYIESDEERQRVLEAAGWEFHRIKYSDWIKKEDAKNRILKEVLNSIG